MKVVVIIPTYNEKGNIEKLIPILEEKIFPTIKKHSMCILIADDNSPDGTIDSVREFMKKWENIDINIGEKKGLGAAYVRAMSYAVEKMNADVMFEMDADFFHDPEKIPEFIKEIEEGYDMVIGTRYSNGGSIPSNWGIDRKIYSVAGNMLVRSILMRFSIHDWTGGYRALKKAVFLKEKNSLQQFTGYTFQVAFLHKAVQDGFKVAEVPFDAVDRTYGRSKFAPLEYIFNLLKYVIVARIKELVFGKFGKFLVVGGFGFVINTVALRLLVEKAHFAPESANLVGAAIAIFSNFNLNNLWTFKDTKFASITMYLLKLVQFYATSAFGVIVIQTGTIALGDKLFGKQLYFLYYIFGTGLLLIWNFTIYNLVIWKKPQK